MATVTKPLALNESLNTTEQNPRNVADVLSDGLENIKQAIEGGSSGGHTIQNSAGTDLPQEEKMQFVDSHVSDDSTNGRTVVENIKEHTTASDYEQATEDGIHVIDNGDDALIGAVSDDYVEVTADGDKTLSTLLNELFALTDFSKISEHSYILSGANNKNLYYIAQYNSTNQTATFVWNDIYSSTKFIQQIYNLNSNSSAEQIFGTDYSSISGVKLSSGTKITLYYGNKKATVDLQTKAERCLYDSNTTVKQKIDTKLDSSSVASGVVTCPYSSTYFCIGSVTVPSTTKAVVANVVNSTDARIDALHTRVMKASDTTWQIVVVGVQFSAGASCTAAWIAL